MSMRLSPGRPPAARPQVQEGLRALQEQREQVFQAWGQQHERLQARSREQLFLRKLGRLDQTLSAQEVGPPHVHPLLPASPLPDSLPCFLGL